jgi:DNA-binding CsgD family transcriptional regulator
MTTRLIAARQVREFIGGLRWTDSPAETASGRAGIALAMLRGVVGYDCAALHRWDQRSGRHDTLASVGYPAASLRMIDRRMHIDVNFPNARADPRAVLLGDIPRGAGRGELYDTVIRPNGFTGGLTRCVFARDGRYLGVLNLSVASAGDPPGEAVALVELLATDLATILDPVPPPAPATLDLATGTVEGLVLDGGPVRPLTSGARPELVAEGSPLRALIAAIRAGRLVARPLLLLAGSDPLDVRIERLAGGAALVLHRPTAPPFGLTPRELEVLDAVSHGRTNAAVGAVLGIAPGTVATHVEHVLAKTGVPNRAAAARLAGHLGLLIWRPDGGCARRHPRSRPE